MPFSQTHYELSKDLVNIDVKISRNLVEQLFLLIKGLAKVTLNFG